MKFLGNKKKPRQILLMHLRATCGIMFLKIRICPQLNIHVWIFAWTFWDFNIDFMLHKLRIIWMCCWGHSLCYVILILIIFKSVCWYSELQLCNHKHSCHLFIHLLKPGLFTFKHIIQIAIIVSHTLENKSDRTHFLMLSIV